MRRPLRMVSQQTFDKENLICEKKAEGEAEQAGGNG